MKKYRASAIQEIYLYQTHLNHTLYPISYQGGGDYRGIYDTGLKGGFMGYIGLLLNAPYKIDSMVWMRMRMMLYVLTLNICSVC
jgi:hypothetical protein